MALIDLANPTRFLAFAERILPWLTAATVITLAIGLAQALFIAPDDYQQGATVKIMFIHVPSAYLGIFCWVLMSASALGTLVWRHPLADVAAKTAAPIGAAFTFICLFTGSMWGRPMWGTYWVWDGRLTSWLVLFLMYLGLIAIWRTAEDSSRVGVSVAILTLVGAINLPIIHFSVECWNTLHQGASILRFSPSYTSLVCRVFGVDQPLPADLQTLPLEKPAIHFTILVPLFSMLLAFTLLFFTLHVAAMRNEILRRRVRSLMLIQAERAR